MVGSNRSRGIALKKNDLVAVSKQTRRRPAIPSVPKIIPEHDDNGLSRNAENLEAMLHSPTTTKRRVKSQERTPTGQNIARPEKLKNEITPPEEHELNSEVEQMSIDMNSNRIREIGNNGIRRRGKKFEDVEMSIDMESSSAHRSPTTGRNLLKQLQTTLSPKMTEVNVNEDRRVSRYGRHQKQKENINYVPGELMKFLGKTPPKIKPKRDGIGNGDEFEPDQKFEVKMTHETEFEGSKKVSLSVESEGDRDSPAILSVLHDQSEDIIGMDAIDIIGMDVSFDNINGEIPFLEKALHKKSIDHNHSSDVDSAKGSSIYLEVEYRPGQIYWAAQNMKTVHWPCIVRVDPATNQITRKHPEKSLEIHVAFFGDRGRRGWIREACMVPFSGLENYHIRAENLEFGKAIKKALKVTAMRKTWKHASDQAEEFIRIEIGQRLQQFDINVKLERMRGTITAGRTVKTEREYKHQKPFVVNKTSSTKRQRSTTPESPPYEVLHDSLENETKKIRLHTNVHSSLQNNNNENAFLHSLEQQAKEKKTNSSVADHEMNAFLSEDSKYYTEIVYKLLVNIGRTFLIDGQTTGGSAELLQRYARNISLLKIDDNHGTKRTSILRELRQLRKLCQLVDGFVAENNLHKDKGSVVRIKKEKLTLEEKFIFQQDPKALIKGLPKGFVCDVCERPKTVVKCTRCLRNMHIACVTADPLKQVNLLQLVEEKRFSCIECAQAEVKDDLTKQQCFVCNDESEDAKNEPKSRCTVRLCSRQYHLSCLRLFPQFALLNPQTIICPYHVCHTCVSDDPRGKATTAKATLVCCVKCPSAYHGDIKCIPAGSELLTTHQLICPKHSLEQVALNVNWCFLCCKGGDLICCETCPNAFHRDCLPFTVPEGKYFCEECESGRLPLYNEIVVAKLGGFRWWPALIVPPSEISEILLQQRPSGSSVCVKFFQSHTVAWLNRRRMYLYEHADSENLGAKKSGTLDKQYRIAMAEASKIYKAMQALKNTQDARFVPKQKVNTPIFTKIKVNRYIAPLKQPPSRVDSSCYCRPDDDDPCGPTSSCINRAIMIECIPKTCPAKERCSNQRFAKRIYPSLEVCHFSGKGYGIVAKEVIENGQFIIEYVGEVINSNEFDRRILAMRERKVENYYFLTVEPDMTIDARPKGNISRFINHSCEPNCETQKWSIGNSRVIGLFAIKDISVGEELTFNYNLESLGNKKRPCLCGATKCSGFIGEKYRSPKVEPTQNSTNRKRVGQRITTTKKTGTRKRQQIQQIQQAPSSSNQVPSTDEDVEIVQTPEAEIIDLVTSNAGMQYKPDLY